MRKKDRAFGREVWYVHIYRGGKKIARMGPYYSRAIGANVSNRMRKAEGRGARVVLQKGEY